MNEDNANHTISQVMSGQVEQSDVDVRNVTITSMSDETIQGARLSRGTALVNIDKLYSIPHARPLAIALTGVTPLMLLTQHSLWSVALAMIAWGTINSAIPVCWSTWLSIGVSDEPESRGGLLVGAIQLAIMSGGALGGYLLDRTSITGTFVGASVLMLLAACVVGNGHRLRPLP